MVDYDYKNGLPPTDPKDIIDWKHFNTDFFSTEQIVDQDVFDNLSEFRDRYVDVRPYMIHNPLRVHPDDDLIRVLELFRQHHIRHLLVCTRQNGSLVGIITR